MPRVAYTWNCHRINLVSINFETQGNNPENIIPCQDADRRRANFRESCGRHVRMSRFEYRPSGRVENSAAAVGVKS